MSNKSQLQTNNIDLQSILSTVLGLPTQESCKNGQYVWKRYEYTPERTVTNPTFKFATISSSVSTIKITSDSVDLTKVTSEFFAGFTFTDTTGTSCNFKLNTGTGDGELIMFMGLSVYLNYDPESTSFVQAGSMGIGTACSGRTATYSGNKTLPAMQGAFLDYVVSDSESAYPDGGTKDGYWYEKVVEGSKGQEIILFKPTSQITEITVGHSLGVKPSKIALCRLSGDSGNISDSLLCASNSGTSGYTDIFYGATYSSNTAKRLDSNYFTATDKKITFSYEYAKLSQNVTYAIIAVV